MTLHPDDDRDLWVLELAAEGWLPEEIAETLECSIARVRRLIAEAAPAQSEMLQ